MYVNLIRCCFHVVCAGSMLAHGKVMISIYNKWEWEVQLLIIRDGAPRREGHQCVGELCRQHVAECKGRYI